MFGPHLDCGLDRLGHHITLRPPMIKEAPYHREWIGDPAVNKYLARRGRPTLAQERAWLRKSRDDQEEYLWSIWADTVLIGNASLRLNPTLKTGVTGIIIGDQRYWGHGVASCVFARRARFAFTEADCVALFTEAFAANRGSWRAAEMIGFVRYGEKPFADLIDGVYATMYQACLTRERWLELNA